MWELLAAGGESRMWKAHAASVEKRNVGIVCGKRGSGMWELLAASGESRMWKALVASGESRMWKAYAARWKSEMRELFAVSGNAEYVNCLRQAEIAGIEWRRVSCKEIGNGQTVAGVGKEERHG